MLRPFTPLPKITLIGMLAYLCLSPLTVSGFSKTLPHSTTTMASPMQTAEKNKPMILILTTGGTIAGQASGNGIGYTAAKQDGNHLVSAVPALQNEAEIKVESVSQIGSQDMSDAILSKLAKHIQKVEQDPTIKGIVITHGTDTMEETAFFLNNVIRHEKPIVMVGAMRAPGYVSADGPANLLQAVKVAASPAAMHRPVMIVMNDTILDAHSAQKMNTTSVQTFQSPNSGPIGIVNEAQVRFFHPAQPVMNRIFAIPTTTPFPRVDIIYSHVQMDAAPIEDAVKRGAKGIILAGVGNGNTSSEALNALKKAANNGVIIVRASRVATGFVDRNVEVDDDKNHFIAAEDLNPQKARILLQLLLNNKETNLIHIQKAFSKID